MNLYDAIHHKHYISFSYEGSHRVAIPVAAGVSNAGNEVLRAYQIEGSEDSDAPSWKLFIIKNIEQLEVTEATFLIPPEGYSRNDGALRSVTCQI